MHCTNCGANLRSGASQPTGVPPYTQHHSQEYVPNYLVPAILTTIFCCLPFGIVSIVYAAQVNGRVAAGQRTAAAETSRKAKTWAWVAFGSGIVLWLGYLSFTVIAALAGA
ncbi:CD225/dispanin family protein [Rubrobacter aplysinae]|uniref:CD225/dispanin family protein n=1 Tax=Rubrobacter aplysinae TaxID=909625 RepID=UPI000A053C4C